MALCTKFELNKTNSGAETIGRLGNISSTYLFNIKYYYIYTIILL